MDVAEGVGQQVQVAMLEHADAAQIGGGDDRRAWRRELHGRRRRAVGAIDERLRHGDMMPGLPRPVSPGTYPRAASGIAAPRHSGS